MPGNRWFSFDPDGDGFVRHATREEAKAAAEVALDFRRGNAREGWLEEVTSICWGEIVERVIETSRRQVPPGVTVDEDGRGADDKDYSDIPERWRADGIIDYRLRPVDL